MAARRFGLPCRVIIAIMGHLGFAILYSFRVNMSVALVSMVNSTFSDAKSSAVVDPECVGPNYNASLPNYPSEDEGKFNFDQNQQGLILGSFFYGYMCTQIVGGILSIKYGGKWVFGLCVLVTSILTLLTPIAAETGLWFLIALRFAEGFVEGVSMPSLHAMLAKWAPPMERTKLASLLYSGGTVGTVIAMPVSGILCKHGFAGGWPSVFYTFGLLGVVWFFFWSILAYSSPETHPRISRRERDYILASQGPSVSQNERKVPWLRILTSGAVLGILVPYSASNWVFYTALTCLPKYFKEVLNFAIEKDGILSALPFLFAVFIQFVGSTFADFFISRGIFSIQTTRKLFSTLALGIPSIIYGCIGYLGCAQETAAVSLMVLAVALNGFSMSGFAVNHLDISPNFAAILQGVTNTIATIPGCVAPSIVGYFTEDEPTRQQWQKVLFISSGVSAVGTIVFLLLGKGTVQSWNGDYECISGKCDLKESIQDGENNDVI